jgi:small subunit ribosomal protein S16
METHNRRDGRAIDEVGYYNPITKESSINSEKIVKWLEDGVKPTDTVKALLKKAKILTV